MKDNSKIWLISDFHLYHKAIIKYTERPFSSIEEMNHKLIINWNSIVKNDDRVFFLGDFCLAGKEQIISCGQQLKGRKILICGNHDSGSLKTYFEAGFEQISKYPLLLENEYLLSHEPIKDCKYKNIHGHIHNHPLSFDNPENYFNVSVENINYTPISFEKIKEYFND